VLLLQPELYDGNRCQAAEQALYTKASKENIEQVFGSKYEAVKVISKSLTSKTEHLPFLNQVDGIQQTSSLAEASKLVTNARSIS
jgi:hypothetical protein